MVEKQKQLWESLSQMGFKEVLSKDRATIEYSYWVGQTNRMGWDTTTPTDVHQILVAH